MQEIFGNNVELVERFKKSLSLSRFARYSDMAQDGNIKAIELYQWNAKLSQSLYIYLQSWEVCLRNKINDFLSWKYSVGWPYDSRAIRNLKGDDARRLVETKQRQERDRGISPLPTSIIVADLSAGFWVSQLSHAYSVPYSWRYNLGRVFPNDGALNQRTAWEICDRLLTLRNRVAHHEPILNMALDDRRNDLQRIVAAMCDATAAFSERSCTFQGVWAARP